MSQKLIKTISLIIFLLLATSESHISESKTFQKKNTMVKLNPKVDRFLKDFLKAGSFKDLKGTFRSGNFTKAELKQLENEIKKSPYLQKMENLKQKAIANAKKQKPPIEKDLQKRLKQKQIDFQKKQSREIARINTQTQKRWQLTDPKGTKAFKVRYKQPLKVSPALKTEALTSSRSTSARIHSIMPHPAIAGRTLTISGENFGAYRSGGIVVIRLEGNLVECPVDDWRNDRIIIRVSTEIEPILEGREKQGLVWVKLHGRDRGPTYSIRIRRGSPIITSSSPHPIMPGQELDIRGNNFFPDRGMVTFWFGSRSYRGQIIEWENSKILVRLPDNISGVTARVIAFVVKTDQGLEGRSRVAFIPLEEMKQIDASGPITLECFPRTPFYPNAAADPLCFFGNSLRYEINCGTLHNGWKVAEGDYRFQRRTGINSGAYYHRPPREGSTRTDAVITVWVDAFSSITVIPQLWIRGPRDTDHY